MALLPRITHYSICLTGQNTIRYYLHLNNFIYQAYVTIKMPKYDRKCFEEDEASNRPYTSRYIGSLVSDFHRNMLKGGIYIYPTTTRYPNGKLRLLYEGNPMAFLAEQAGGMATDGYRRILDIQPTALHERTPLFIGSKNMVEKAGQFMKDFKE